MRSPCHLLWEDGGQVCPHRQERLTYLTHIIHVINKIRHGEEDYIGRSYVASRTGRQQHD